MKDLKKRFEFIRCCAHGLRDLPLWWKFLNGDDNALAQIEDLRKESKYNDGRLI